MNEPGLGTNIKVFVQVSINIAGRLTCSPMSYVEKISINLPQSVPSALQFHLPIKITTII